MGSGLGLAQGCHSLQGHDLGGHARHSSWRLLARPQPEDDLRACCSDRAWCLCYQRQLILLAFNRMVFICREQQRSSAVLQGRVPQNGACMRL